MGTVTKATTLAVAAATVGGSSTPKGVPVTTHEYREKINAELPEYRAIHSMRINKGDRILITRHALEYDQMLRSKDYTLYEARAELRRRHATEWREILRGIPGTIRDIRLGLTLDKLREWPWE